VTHNSVTHNQLLKFFQPDPIYLIACVSLNYAKICRKFFRSKNRFSIIKERPKDEKKEKDFPFCDLAGCGLSSYMADFDTYGLLPEADVGDVISWITGDINSSSPRNILFLL